MSIDRRTVMLCAALLCCAALPVHAEQPLMVHTPQLSMDTALRIANAAIKTCRGKGVSIAVTVIDRGGNPQVVLRDTLAARLTLQVSREKAYAALSFNTPTSALGARADTPLGRLPGLLMSAGAVPVHAGGQLVGAVGVSGAPSGTTDEACAKAGVAAVQDDLDMAGG
ncbi:MAG: heme-binding protein [Acidihalobacter sp.]